MKKIAIVLAVLILYFPLTGNDLPVRNQMNVTAPSGLKLRAHPGIESEVLKVIPYRAKVEILENEMVHKVKDVINYLEGYWIYVDFEGTEGFVFDAFLTNLPIPHHSFEKSQFDLDLCYPLESWIGYHHQLVDKVDTFHSELYSKVVSQYTCDLKMECMFTDQYYKITAFLPDARLSEAYYLLYNMLNTEEEQSRYSQKTVFVKNRDGLVDKVKIDLRQPVLLQKKGGGIEIVIKSFGEVCDF